MTKGTGTRVGAFAVTFAAVGFVAGCANERGPNPDLPPLGVRLEFLAKNLCSQGISPEIRLGGVPANTASYRLRLTNISIVNATRWEASVKAEGPVISEAMIGDFDAPCPGEQQSFTYRLEVMALGPSGQPLAYGWNFAQARSLTRQIEQEQAELKRHPIDRPNRSAVPAARHPAFFTQ